MTEILITDRPRTGRSALLWRDSDEVWQQTEGVPTVPVAPPADPLPPWPVIDVQGLPNDRRVAVLRLPLITRIRQAVADWIAPR